MAIPGTDITWQAEPLFVVGATDAGGREVGPPLYMVRGARIRSDSGLVIVQHSVQSLLVFDREGALRETVGGDGDGPGEFRRVRSVTLLARDSMLAWDAGLKRFSVFDRSGELSEVISLTDMIRRAGSPLNLHMVGTETIVTVSTPRGAPAYLRSQGLSRDEHTIQFLDRQGWDVGIIDRIEGWEMYRGERTIAVPYSYRLHIAGGHRELFAGDGRGPHLTEFAITGEPTRRLQLPIEREELSKTEFSARIQEYVNENYLPEDRVSEMRTNEAAASASVIDSLPAFIDLLSDRDGQLWLKVSGRGRDEPGRWLVVDPDTNEAWWVRGHPGWTVLDAAHGLVAALYEDDFGTESVALFEVRH